VVSGAPTGGGIYVHGARDRAWNYTLDGIDTNDSSQGGSNTTSFRVNPDMLDEMRILTGNNTAENGRNSGGQVAMVTRSGSNDFHGDGFWFYRTPRLNANEWQNNLDNLGKAQLQQNIYGGGIGGPVVKNKTFFFAQIQALRARSSAATSRTVYTATARTGILRYVKGGRNQPAGTSTASVDSAGNPLPGLSIGTYNIATNDPQHIGLDPTMLAEIKNEPLPNTFTVGDGLNTAGYTFSAQASERQHDQTIKIDQIVNGKNTVYGRVAWGRDDSLCDVVNTGQPVFPGGPCLVNTLRGPRNFAINWRFTPTSSMTNEFVIGQNRYDPIFGQPSSLDKISFASTPVDNTAQYYFGNSRVVSTWQVVDNFAYFRGSHAFKFGTNLRQVREEDIRGSVAGLNANEEVNFSTSVNTVDPATFGLPSDLNTTFDRPAFQSNINFLLGRVGQIDRGFVNQGDQWTKKHLPVRHALSGIRVLRAGYLEGAPQPHRRSRPALRDPPVAPDYADQQHPGAQPGDGGRRRAQQHRAVGARKAVQEPVGQFRTLAGLRLGSLPHRQDLGARQLPDRLRPHQRFRGGFHHPAQPAGRRLRRHQYRFRPERRTPLQPAGAQSAHAPSRAA
jgi:hypothetical protein